MRKIKSLNKVLLGNFLKTNKKLSSTKVMASDYKDEIRRLEEKCSNLARARDEDNESFNQKLDTFIEAKTAELKAAEEAIVKLRTEGERLRATMKEQGSAAFFGRLFFLSII